jgi:hypothetical protein
MRHDPRLADGEAGVADVSDSYLFAMRRVM